MATPTAQELIDRAYDGYKCTTKERRHVITWLQATSGNDKASISMTNRELGALFGVTERTIRQDKQSFRKEKAKFIREDDISLIIADIALDYERQIRDIEKSKQKAVPGSITYLRHCTDALELRIKMVKALQDLGYYPKNLGQLTVTKWDFMSKVDPTTGFVLTEAVESTPILDAEFTTTKELTQGQPDANNRTNESDTYSCKIGVTSGPSETV